jgi:hypothetical protein
VDVIQITQRQGKVARSAATNHFRQETPGRSALFALPDGTAPSSAYRVHSHPVDLCQESHFAGGFGRTIKPRNQ